MSDNWCTPSWLTDAIGEVDLDPCSNPASTVRLSSPGKTLSLEKGEDGLAYGWASIPLIYQVPAGSLLPYTAHYLGHSATSAVQYPETAFVNPPYSNPMPWCERAVEFWTQGGSVLLLLKLDPTTKWWAKLWDCPGFSPHLFRKRIKFSGAPNVAPWPSALVSLTHLVESAHFRNVIARLKLAGHIW